ARVVLGAITPKENFDGRVTGEMVSAWVEVYFDGAGWVPFDTTPPIASKPHRVYIQKQQNLPGQVLEPPLLQAQPPGPMPPPQADKPIDDINCLLGLLCFNGLPRWAVFTIRYVLPPVLAIGAVLAGIVLAKAMRRRRRRTRGTPVEQVSGAWQE